MALDKQTLAVITDSSVEKLTKLAELGRGEIQTAAWLDDTTLAVATPLGLWHYGVNGSDERISSFDDGSFAQSSCSMFCSQDKELLVVFPFHEKNDAIHLYDLHAGDKIDTIQTGESFGTLRLSSDNTMLAFGTYGNKANLIDTRTKNVTSIPVPEKYPVTPFFTYDRNLIIIASQQRIYCYNLTSKKRQTLVDLNPGDKPRSSFDRDSYILRGLSLSPNRRILAFIEKSEHPSLHYSGMIKLLDVGSGEIAELAEAKGAWSLVWDHESRLLAFRNQDGIQVWDTVRKQMLTPFGESDYFGPLHFSPDGKQLIITICEDDTLVFSDIYTAEVTAHVEQVGVKILGFSPDSAVLAVENRNGAVCICDLKTSQRHVFSHGHQGFVDILHFNSDGHTLTTASTLDHKARLWNIGTGESPDALHVYGGRSPLFVLNPEGKLLSSTDGSKYGPGLLWVRDLETGEDVYLRECGIPYGFSLDGSQLLFLGEHDPLNMMVLSQSRRVMAYENDQHLYAVDLDTSQERYLMTLQAGRQMRLSPNLEWVVDYPKEGLNRIEIRSLETGEQHLVQTPMRSFNRKKPSSPSNMPQRAIHLFNHWIRKPTSIAVSLTLSTFLFSPDSALIASASSDKNENNSVVEIWNVSSGQYMGWVPLPLQGRPRMVFSEDSRILLVQGDKRAWLCDTENLEITASFPIDMTSRFAFSPGSILVAHSTDRSNTINIWQTTTGKQLTSLKSTSGDVFSLAFNQDGTLLACGNGSGAIELWGVLSTDK